MPATLAEKIIAKASGRDRVLPGEVVTCRLDLAMMHDSGGPRRVKPILERLGVGVWDPDKVVVVTDHFVPADEPASQTIQALTKNWVRAQAIRAFYDQVGICHIVLPEHGHLKPGMLVVGGDSHSTTGGAFGAYMFGIGATEMAGVLATGEIWLKVPETILITFNGRLGPLVTAKDIMLFLCGRFGMDGGQYQAVQYDGEAISRLAIQDRMTLANMTAELGGQTGLIAPDAVTKAYLADARGAIDDGDLTAWQTDHDAPLLARHVFDARALEPQVAAPDSPANAVGITSSDHAKVDVVYIGACTGAKLADLRMAASILKGRKRARHVDLMVAPASRRDQDKAEAEGLMTIFEQAGARILPNSCGICAGYGEERLGENVTCIATTARNFKGRMGAASSKVYLASPYTVAASAVAGRIMDPREIMAEGTAP